MTAPTPTSPLAPLVERGCVAADPLPWLLASDEPSARFIALTRIAGVSEDHPDAVSARREVLADPGVTELLAELPAEGERPGVDDHTSPLFVPNRLGLLADLGVRAGDDVRVDALIASLLASRDRQGRFIMPATLAARPKPERGAVTCDSNAIIDVLVRLGLREDPAVVAALRRLASDAAPSPEGRGWRCQPEKRPLIDFAASKAHACPQVTLEGARALALLPAAERPSWAAQTARTLLAFWRSRGDERPYDFGHGYQFKTVKWPLFWYDALLVLDVAGHYPELWDGPHARDEDARAIAELAAAIIAHNVGADGRVTPARTYRGFERFSFGRRGEPSATATAQVYAVLARLAPLAALIAEVDVDSLPPSRAPGARPADDRGSQATAACPVPVRRGHDPARVLPRILARHHLGTPWEPASIESLAADMVGLVSAEPATPYLSLAARLPEFDPTALDRALDERRSLVRFRCMRGVLYAVRRDFVATVHAASTRQVVRFARDFVRSRGVSPAQYESVAAQVLDACAEQPLTTRELRDRLRPAVDLAAVVTLMCAEAALLRSAPRDGRFGRATTFTPFEAALPDVRLGRMSEDAARAALLRAYVRGFGPVSARDAAWWTGMDLKRVRRAFDALEDELVEISLDGHEGTWLMHAADVEELERAAIAGGPHVALLPALDPLVMSYTDRSRFVSDEVRPFVFDAARNVAPVVVVDGVIAGIWDITRGPEPSVLVHLFDPDPVAAALVEDAARPVARARLGVAAPVRRIERARALTKRPIGAFRHPLR